MASKKVIPITLPISNSNGYFFNQINGKHSEEKKQNREKDNFREPKTIEEILDELEIPHDIYYHFLKISPDNSYQINFKRTPKSCFTNNYFEEGLLAWEANIDIQPVLDYYKAVTYMCNETIS